MSAINLGLLSLALATNGIGRGARNVVSSLVSSPFSSTA